MLDIQKEREAFEDWYKKIHMSGFCEQRIKNHANLFRFYEVTNEYIHSLVNAEWKAWLGRAESKQAEIDTLKEKIAAYESQLVEMAAELDAAKHENCELEDKLSAAHKSRIEFVEYMRKIESGDYVLVPKECPDPDFADALFDSLNATYDDDFVGYVELSDIDPQKIYNLVVTQGESHE